MNICKHRLYHAIGVPCECIPPYVVLMSFMAWLTVRNQAVTFSAHDNAGPAVELIEKFCTKQGWAAKDTEEFKYWLNILKPMSPNE